ncbi:MAG: pilus assembly protein [Parvularculaceae bacterium]
MRKLINRLFRGARRAAADREGSTAVEFAIIAPTFLALMFSTFEVGWFYFANSQVDGATLEAARYIRTGQAQESNLTKDEFFDHVCPYLEVFGQCQNNLTVEVQTFSTFAALAADNSPVVCRDDPQAAIDAINYTPGTDDSIVRLRICLLYHTINPAIGVNVADSSNGKRRLYGTYIFRNEPYSKNNRNGS